MLHHKIKMESTFFVGKKNRPVGNKKFGFKSNFTPPQHELLPPFKSDLYDMIQSINFKPVRSYFQKKLTEDINNIRSSENLLIFAGKTTNVYEMTPEQYKTILSNNVTKACRKVEQGTQLNINREAKTIFKTLHLKKAMERYAERHVFIFLKEHRRNFKDNTRYHLIYPFKGQIEIVKKILRRNQQ